MKLRILMACILPLTLAACGANPNPLGRSAISGEIYLKGQPLDNGVIQFSPAAGGDGIGSGALIARGTYEIKGEQGLPPGTYVVRISAAGGMPEDIEPGGDATNVFATELIPEDYNTKSTHTVEVKDGAKNKFDFRIE